MKLGIWSWSAVVADVGLFLGPLPHATSNSAYLELWALHAGCCAILATTALLVMPLRQRATRHWTWLLLFCFSLMAPVLGPLSIVLIAQSALRRALHQRPLATPQSVEVPEFELRAQQSTRTGQAAIRSRLNPAVTAPVRMRSLLTLQAVPSRVANPILESLLGDDSDDVRLVAFGMLDAEEKKLSRQIQQEQHKLASAPSDQVRYDCLRQLAELHWEMVYSGLASGGLKLHNLRQARSYLETALGLSQQHNSGLWFLQGRILLAQGETEPATAALEKALTMGHAPASVRPYLAEIAFSRGDYPAVRQQLQALAAQRMAAKTAAIVDLWTGRESVLNFRDRHQPEHL